MNNTIIQQNKANADYDQDEFHKFTDQRYIRHVARLTENYHEETVRLKSDAWWSGLQDQERKRLMPIVTSEGLVATWRANCTTPTST